MYQICLNGENFFNNMFKLLKIVDHFRSHSIQDSVEEKKL
jgi:hypothetical protein